MKGFELIKKFSGIEDTTKRVYLSCLDEDGLQYSSPLVIRGNRISPGEFVYKWPEFVKQIDPDLDYPGITGVIVSADSVHIYEKVEN